MNQIFTVNIPNSNAGFGAVNTLPDEVKRLHAVNPLVITDKGLTAIGLVKTVTDLLKNAGIDCVVFDELEPCPSADTVKKIGELVREGKHDLLIGFGGGTAIDIAKAVSVTAISSDSIDDILENPVHPELNGPMLPKIFIPTTSGTGSEWSNVIVLFQYTPVEREVVTFSWDYMADKVLIDPELTKGLPPRITADTGFDALCHAMEGYVTPLSNIYTDMLATTAIELVGKYLRRAVADGKDQEARYHMSMAAAFAMNACAAGGVGLTHLMNEIIVSHTKASHGTVLAVTTLATMDYNLEAAQSKYAGIAKLLGENVHGISEAEAARKAVDAVRKLLNDINLPTSLSEIGVDESDIPKLAQKLLDINGPVIPVVNPKDVSLEQAEAILKAAL